MRILHAIHGYPMRYNAGSEVYTQALAHAQASRHEVHVFTRFEDPFSPDFHMKTEADPRDERITLHLVNLPGDRDRDRYRHPGMDERFGEVLDRVMPDIVHVGHLNHLSTTILDSARVRGLPIVFTLHDYWLMCPRGQLMQMFPEDPNDLWPVCPGQQDRRCAERCYARYQSGSPDEREQDIVYWTDWVSRRMSHVRAVCDKVDRFIAPSRYLYSRFRDDFGLPESKLHCLDYGFSRERLSGRNRIPGEPFTFGYIGTHIPAKGISVLLTAFGKLEGDCRLRIWGRPKGQATKALHDLTRSLPGDAASRVEWLPEYANQDITHTVFNRVDAIVVPSIWLENSPLVIHEAQQSRIPVITADVGGMAELVRHEENGRLFRHRDPSSLASEMQRFIDAPDVASRLGQRGCLASTSGDVMDIDDHARRVETIYEELRPERPGPWRITFDTNPDDCNLKCIMCEEHSPYSDRQSERRAAGKAPRRMDISLIRKVMAEAAPHGLREVIPSTMGEPLLFKDFDGILSLCQEYGVLLNLTTNGTFPGRGARDWAERIVPVTSDIKISWNGATAQTQEAIMVGSQWDKVLDNVKTLIAVRDAHAEAGGHRCRVTFQLTFLQLNVSELPGVVHLAARLGVDRVKGHHLWAHFNEIKPLSMRRSPSAIEEWNRAVREAQSVARSNPLSSGVSVLLENIFEIDPETGAEIAPGGLCPFLGQEAWVSAEGRFDPCCAPDAQRRTLGDFGNLHDAPFMEIWQSRPYRDLTGNYQARALCKGCNMRKPREQT